MGGSTGLEEFDFAWIPLSDVLFPIAGMGETEGKGNEMRLAVILCLMMLLVPPSAEAAKKKAIVGGPCAYEEFSGSCTPSGRDAAGTHAFTFVGFVRDREVELEGNAMMAWMSLPRGSVACKLLFIKEGTCTPCAFSIGECGQQAWDLFREQSKPQKKKRGR